MTLDKPYIAAVNGAAVGAGMDMASMADIRIASDTARFGMAYVRMGIIPGDGGAFYLGRILGIARALELIWTGDLFNAQQALEWGYVSRVVPADSLVEETRAFARRLAEGPAVAIQLAKRLVYRSLDMTEDAALDMAQAAMVIAQSTEDAKEGPRAFVDKRAPKFVGRYPRPGPAGARQRPGVKAAGGHDHGLSLHARPGGVPHRAAGIPRRATSR
jgi:2-(1,2-epoxy-1,2-dihydrophenyl)acetyl-CoA isomerase